MFMSFYSLWVKHLHVFAYSLIQLADVVVQRNFGPTSLTQRTRAHIPCDVLFVSKCTDVFAVTSGKLSARRYP